MKIHKVHNVKNLTKISKFERYDFLKKYNYIRGYCFFPKRCNELLNTI